MNNLSKLTEYFDNFTLEKKLSIIKNIIPDIENSTNSVMECRGDKEVFMYDGIDRIIFEKPEFKTVSENNSTKMFVEVKYKICQQ